MTDTKEIREKFEANSNLCFDMVEFVDGRYVYYDVGDGVKKTHQAIHAAWIGFRSCYEARQPEIDALRAENARLKESQERLRDSKAYLQKSVDKLYSENERFKRAEKVMQITDGTHAPAHCWTDSERSMWAVGHNHLVMKYHEALQEPSSD